MTSDDQLSPEEIGRRITAGMGLVYDLFKEMHSLFRLIAQGLRDSEADVQVMPIKAFLLPRGKKGTTVADLFLRTDMGLLAAVGSVSATDGEEDVDAGGDEDDAEAETDK